MDETNETEWSNDSLLTVAEYATKGISTVNFPQLNTKLLLLWTKAMSLLILNIPTVHKFRLHYIAMVFHLHVSSCKQIRL